MNITVASKNEGKINEIEYVMNRLGGNFKLVTMSSRGVEDDIVEDGDSFEANALIKARYLHKKLGGNVMADDSGLMVDALDGAPGIYSARFAGEHSDDEARNRKLLSLLEDVPFAKRNARFVCVIAFISEDGREFITRGTCDGIITMRKIGNNGFGYDPLLYLEDRKCTVAQLPASEKNKVSHRAKAVQMMYEVIKENFGNV